jgi:hypothetical protein
LYSVDSTALELVELIDSISFLSCSISLDFY